MKETIFLNHSKFLKNIQKIVFKSLENSTVIKVAILESMPIFRAPYLHFWERQTYALTEFFVGN